MVKKHSFLEDVSLFFIICVVVTIAWQLLEVAIYGKIEERGIDTIICCVLSFSILKNVRFSQQLINQRIEQQTDDLFSNNGGRF